MTKTSQARIQVLKHQLPIALAYAEAMGDKPVSTFTNGARAIIEFDSVAQDPFWLLDLRRNGILYTWLWGTTKEWRYIDASHINHRGCAKVIEDTTSKEGTEYLVIKHTFHSKGFTFTELPIDEEIAA